ncbi:MAG TPA: energy transducer TonB [Polyangiaceae bacterium]|jgi:protein TonB
MNGWHVAGPRSEQPPSSRGPSSFVPSSRVPSSRVPRWIRPTPSPLARVLDLGGDKAVRVLAVAFVLSIAAQGIAAVRTAYIHAEMINWTMRLDAVINKRLVQEVDIEEMRTPEPRAKIEEKKEDPPPEPEKMVEKVTAPAPAAQAAQVMAANPDQPYDFGDNVFAVGNSARFAGGATMSDGKNDKAVVAAHVAPAGTGNGQAAPQIQAVDLSRTAELAGSGEWRCPFPAEADADQVDEASSVIEVTVGADGRPSGARVLQDPGHGFGREARACAMRESYVPALDRDGRAVSSSKKFRVKFER